MKRPIQHKHILIVRLVNKDGKILAENKIIIDT